MSGAYNAEGQLNTADTSAVDVVAITTDDSALYNPPLRGIYVGVTGDIQIESPVGNTVLFSSVPAGYILPVYCSIVYATNTTADNLVGLY